MCLHVKRGREVGCRVLPVLLLASVIAHSSRGVSHLQRTCAAKESRLAISQWMLSATKASHHIKTKAFSESLKKDEATESSSLS